MTQCIYSVFTQNYSPNTEGNMLASRCVIEIFTQIYCNEEYVWNVFHKNSHHFIYGMARIVYSIFHIRHIFPKIETKHYRTLQMCGCRLTIFV